MTWRILLRHDLAAVAKHDAIDFVLDPIIPELQVSATDLYCYRLRHAQLANLNETKASKNAEDTSNLALVVEGEKATSKRTCLVRGSNLEGTSREWINPP